MVERRDLDSPPWWCPHARSILGTKVVCMRARIFSWFHRPGCLSRRLATTLTLTLAAAAVGCRDDTGSPTAPEPGPALVGQLGNGTRDGPEICAGDLPCSMKPSEIVGPS